MQEGLQVMANCGFIVIGHNMLWSGSSLDTRVGHMPFPAPKEPIVLRHVVSPQDEASAPECVCFVARKPTETPKGPLSCVLAFASPQFLPHHAQFGSPHPQCLLGQGSSVLAHVLFRDGDVAFSGYQSPPPVEAPTPGPH
jgi:hypothetical protein